MVRRSVPTMDRVVRKQNKLECQMCAREHPHTGPPQVTNTQLMNTPYIQTNIWETRGMDKEGFVGGHGAAGVLCWVVGHFHVSSLFTSPPPPIPHLEQQRFEGGSYHKKLGAQYSLTRLILESIRPAGGCSSHTYLLSHHSCFCDSHPQIVFVHFWLTNSLS